MRILFYAEPHPIRNTFVEFKTVAADVSRMLVEARKADNVLLKSCDIRIYGNEQTLASVLKSSNDTRAFFLYPSSTETEMFASYAHEWIPEGVAEWKNLILGEGSITDDYIAILKNIWIRFPFDIIVYWGSNGAIARFCAQEGIRQIAMESGCTRPPYLDSVIFDPCGSNGASYLAKLSIEEILATTEKSRRSSFTDLALFSDAGEVRPYELQFEYAPFQGLKKLLASDRRRVFLPLQLPDDANLIAYSPFSTLVELIRQVVDMARKHDNFLVVKPHPASRLRINGTAEALLAKTTIDEYDHAVWIDPEKHKVSTTTLMAMTDATVTVNSSVGFEALFHNKPVALLGSAVYAPLGLFPSPDAVMNGSFDHEYYTVGAAAVRSLFLDTLLVERQSAFRLETFLARVLTIARLHHELGSNPRTYLSALTGAFGTTAHLINPHGFYRLAGTWRQMSTPPSSIAPSQPPKPKNRSSLGLVNRALRVAIARWQARLVRHSGLFDPAYYLEQNPDVAASGMDPAYHFVRFGGVEGRNPSPLFSTRNYLDANPDVRASEVNPLVHYLRVGRFKERLVGGDNS